MASFFICDSCGESATEIAVEVSYPRLFGRAVHICGNCAVGFESAAQAEAQAAQTEPRAVNWGLVADSLLVAMKPAVENTLDGTMDTHMAEMFGVADTGDLQPALNTGAMAGATADVEVPATEAVAQPAHN